MYWASGLFSIIFSILAHAQGVWANWLLSIYFQPQSEAVPGNVLAERMRFMKTRCRVSWLFTYVNLNSVSASFGKKNVGKLIALLKSDSP